MYLVFSYGNHGPRCGFQSTTTRDLVTHGPGGWFGVRHAAMTMYDSTIHGCISDLVVPCKKKKHQHFQSILPNYSDPSVELEEIWCPSHPSSTFAVPFRLLFFGWSKLLRKPNTNPKQSTYNNSKQAKALVEFSPKTLTEKGPKIPNNNLRAACFLF